MSRRKSIPAVWRDAIRGSCLDPTARHVAHALSTWMDAHGFCYPGRETIAEGTGYSVRTVERAAQRLEAGGWLRVERGTGQRSNCYYALLPLVASESRHREWSVATTATRSGDPDDRSGDTGVALKRLKREKAVRTDAAAPLLGSAASAHAEENGIPDDPCFSCRARPVVGPDFIYCAECQKGVDAMAAEGAR